MIHGEPLQEVDSSHFTNNEASFSRPSTSTSTNNTKAVNQFYTELDLKIIIEGIEHGHFLDGCKVGHYNFIINIRFS